MTILTEQEMARYVVLRGWRLYKDYDGQYLLVREDLGDYEWLRKHPETMAALMAIIEEHPAKVSDATREAVVNFLKRNGEHHPTARFIDPTDKVTHG